MEGGAGAVKQAPAPPPAAGGHVCVGVLNSAVGEPVYVSPAELATVMPLTGVPDGLSTVSEKSPLIGVTIDRLPKSEPTAIRNAISNVKPLPQLEQLVIHVTGALGAPAGFTTTNDGGKSGLAAASTPAGYSRYGNPVISGPALCTSGVEYVVAFRVAVLNTSVGVLKNVNGGTLPT